MDYLIVPLKVLLALQSTPASSFQGHSIKRPVAAPVPTDGQTFRSEEVSSSAKGHASCVGPSAHYLVCLSCPGSHHARTWSEEQ